MFLKKMLSLILSATLVAPGLSFADQELTEVTWADHVRREAILLDPGSVRVPDIDMGTVSCFEPIKILEQIDPNDVTSMKCWDYKRVYNETNRPSDLAILKGEKKVCDCLKKSKNESIRKMMSSPNLNFKARNSGTLDLEDVQHNVNTLTATLNNLRNGLGFQASVISSRTDSAHDLTALYNNHGVDRAILTVADEHVSLGRSAGNFSRNREHLNGATSPERGRMALEGLVEAQLSSRSTNNNKSSDSKNSRDQAILKGMSAGGRAFGAGIMSRLVIESPVANTDLLSEGEFARNQCVGPREYAASKQIPSDARFYSDLEQLSRFEENDWDYKILKERFENLTSQEEHKPNEVAEIKSLRSRLLFLSRNPMIKYVFSAQINDQLPQEIRTAIGNVNLLAKKNQLFETLKRNLVDPNRSPQGLDTRITQYRNELTGFFLSSAVGALSKYEAEKEAKQVMVDFVASNRAVQPRGEITSFDQLEDAYVNTTKDRSPTTCRSNSLGNFDLSGCVDTYSAYCPMVTPLLERKLRESTDGLSNDLEFLLKDDSNTKFDETNPQFLAFNKEVCETPRVRSGIFQSSNSAKTFFSYRDEICPNPSNPDCGTDAASIARLRHSFLETYSKPARSSESEIDPARVAILNSSQVKNISLEAARGAVQNKTEASDMGTGLGNILDRDESSARLYSSYSGEGQATSMRALAPISPTPATSVVAVSARMNQTNYNQLDESYTPSINPIINSEVSLPRAGEQITETDRERIRTLAEEEIARSRSEATSGNMAQKQGNEERVRLLEELLAQKNENELKYRQLIEQLNNRNEELNTASAAAEQAAPAQVANNRRNAESQASSTIIPDSEESRRAPASVNEAPRFNTSGANSGAGAVNAGAFSGSNSSATGSRGSSFNSALLEAQEARSGRVQRSSDGTIILASDADGPNLRSMSSAILPNTDYSLNVTAADYIGFESQNMEVIRRYQERLMGNIESNQPIRVLVRSESRDALEFYVVKDGNKLFFKPVRKTGATLEALQQTVRQNP